MGDKNQSAGCCVQPSLWINVYLGRWIWHWLNEEKQFIAAFVLSKRFFLSHLYGKKYRQGKDTIVGELRKRRLYKVLQKQIHLYKYTA